MQFSSLDSHFVDWPLVAGTLNNGILFFFIGLSSWTVCTEIFVFLNSKLFNLPDYWYSIISHDFFCSQLNLLLWMINNERSSKLLNFFWQIINMLSEFFLKSRWIFVVIVLWMLISFKNCQVFKFWNNLCHLWAANMSTSKLVFVFTQTNKASVTLIRIGKNKDLLWQVGCIYSLSISC